jgi:hypothetical protein
MPSPRFLTTGHTITALTALLAITGTTTAAQGQVFTRLASTATSNIVEIRDVSAPALNNNGVAAFSATIGFFSTPNVYKVDNAGNTTHVAAPIAFGATPTFSAVAINDSGTVAFITTRTVNILLNIPGIYTSTTASAAPTLIDEATEGFSSVNINNDGILSYGFFTRVGQGSTTQIRCGTGPGNIVNVASANINVPQTGAPSGDSVGSVALNNNNSVAFLRTPLNFPPSQVERVDGSGNLAVFAPAGLGFSNVSPAINDASTIAFVAGGNLLLADTPNAFTTVAGGATGFTDISSLSLNNSGDIAFTATNGGVQGIFRALTGAAAAPVIRIGDSLFGSTVAELSLHRDGMNDSGQIAFRYALANGERGIAVTGGSGVSAAAPEPSTFTLIGMAGIVMLPRRRRTRRSADHSPAQV